MDQADDLMDDYNLWQAQDEDDDNEIDNLIEQNNDDDEDEEDEEIEDADLEEEDHHHHHSLAQKDDGHNFSQANCCKGPGGTKGKGEDDDCHCAPAKLKGPDIKKIKELQEKRIREAKAAVIKARETRVKMHEALKKAEEIKKVEAKRQEEVISKAKEAAR